MRETKAMLGILCMVSLCAGDVSAEFAGSPAFVIVPGKGVGSITIMSQPGKQLLTQPTDVVIERTPRGDIKKIKVHGRNYTVQFNHLRVGDEMQRIFRYYEQFEKEVGKDGRLIIRSTRQGIEFIVNMKTETIEEIAVFEPQIPEYYKPESNRAVQKQQQLKPGENKQQAPLKDYYKDEFK